MTKEVFLSKGMKAIVYEWLVFAKIYHGKFARLNFGALS